MFIVMKLHRESLRQMMQKGRVNNSIKIKVLEMLKPQVLGVSHHGDIKDFGFFSIRKFIVVWKTIETAG